MVIVSPTLFARSRGASKIWKRRRIYALSAHFFGRRQNCYSLAIRGVQRAFQYATKANKIKKRYLQTLWETRIDGAAGDFGLSHMQMKNSLNDLGVALDRKTLQNLAIWEPRSFRGLAMLTKAKDIEAKGFNSVEGPPSGVVTRGML